MNDEDQAVAVVGLNWLGDAIMSMPALQIWREEHPRTRVTMVTRPSLAGLWKMHEVVDDVRPFPAGISGLTQTARALRGTYGRAIILPNSFRSALLPWMAQIPQRRGFSGQWRDMLLTERVQRDSSLDSMHQMHEMAALLCPERIHTDLPLPRLVVESVATEKMLKQLPDPSRPFYALIPGAARGASKRWPAEHFIALGRHLAAGNTAAIVLLGTPADIPLCDEICAAIGPAALSLAGKTGMAEFAVALARAQTVIANDSGGMHLAAALGAPVIGIFGLTDPTRTGPLGPHCRVLQHSEYRSRKIARDSKAAIQALRHIQPGEVIEAIESLAKSHRMG